MKIEQLVKNTCLCLALAGSLTLPSAAVLASSVSDNTQITHNEVQIDPVTGEPVTEEEEELSDAAPLGSNVSYDAESQSYVYTLGNDAETAVTTTVVDGMYTNSSVSVSCGSGVTCRVFRNGAEQTDQNMSLISSPGSYVLLFDSSELDTKTSLSFRIIETYTNAAEYRMPEGFRITGAFLDGDAVSYSSDDISFDEEGAYQVYYACESTGVTYTLDCTVDHTAPTLALAAVNDEGYASSAVDLSDLEPGAVIYAEMDGEEIDPGTKLTQPGTYVLTVADSSGNTTVYSFVIRLYFTVSTIVFALLLVVMVGGLVVYIRISARHLKVR